jgi:hypothetical protein
MLSRLRRDAVERRKRAAEHVIAPLEDARAFQRPQVGDVFDHTDPAGVAPWIAAHRARVGRIEIAALAAGTDRRRRAGHGSGQRLEQAFAFFQQHQRSAARRTRPEPGQLGEQLNQTFDFRPCR